MPPRNHKDWVKTPKVEHISSSIYSSHDIYKQELENIFSKVWVPMCHSSELPRVGRLQNYTDSCAKRVACVSRTDVIKTYRNYDK